MDVFTGMFPQLFSVSFLLGCILFFLFVKVLTVALYAGGPRCSAPRDSNQGLMKWESHLRKERDEARTQATQAQELEGQVKAL